MSTRCQVKIVQEGMRHQEAVTLYHHWDGYPKNMVALIVAAGMSIPIKEKWKAGRTGHVASFLCYADPGGFEPEDSHELHGDLSYYYVLHLENLAGGSMGDNPLWELEIFESGDHLRAVHPRTPIGILAETLGIKPYRRSPEGEEIPMGE